MDAVEVTARFGQDGSISPLAFQWRDQSYRVDSTGRRWKDQEGQHILVMVPGGTVYELLFAPGEGRWYLKPAGMHPRAA